MYETTHLSAANNTTGGHNSQLSFYEYPAHKPYINSVHQPLRPSYTISRTVSLPESNRDELLKSFQDLSLKIKTLEHEREQAEMSFHELTSVLNRSSTDGKDEQTTIDEQLEEAEKNFRRLQNQHRRVLQILNDQRSPPPRTRSTRKKRRSSQHNRSLDTTTTGTNGEGRHYRLDMNSIPFILGSSTSPSHNVKSNVQKVISLLKTHNQQLCLSSKDYVDLVQPHLKSELSPHTLLYLDHYNRSANRSSSALPTRSSRRSNASTSGQRRPQSASLSDHQIYSRIKCLRREFVILSREHARLISLGNEDDDDVQILSRRMEIILQELEQLQKQYMRSSREHMEQDLDQTPLETLRRTKLLQLILKDPNVKQQKF